jgi:hypothetical protein
VVGCGLEFGTRSPRQAQIDGQTKWMVFSPPARSRVSSPKLKSGASMPMKAAGRSASSRSPNWRRMRSSSGRRFRAST